MSKVRTKFISSRLFAEPSFIGGMASIFDLGRTLQEYNTSKIDKEADAKALENDWRCVGNDIKTSISQYEQRIIGSSKR